MTAPIVTVHTIGIEREPVVVVENFAPDPHALRAAAAAASFARADTHYPGVKAPPPPDYIRDRWPLIGAIFREVFDLSGRIRVLEASLAIVTTAAEDLTLEQSLPHIDALESGRLALVQYLTPGNPDGTAFYRHRSTGFETVNAARSDRYFSTLAADVERSGPLPRRYPDDATPHFETIAAFEGVFNRALLYRGRVLHSGQITGATRLAPSPAEGRLTVTGFFAA